jgi:hypothetical protein
VVAQTEKDSARPGLMKVYEDWKQKEFADKAELREHLVMVVISQRIEEGRAQLDFALINNFGDRKLGNELMLEIQPMVTLRNADGQPGESRAVGVATRALLSADEASENLNSPSTVSVLVPADPQANSVVVKWALSKRTADAKQALSDNTMHLLLEDAPNSALMAITQAKSSEQ